MTDEKYVLYKFLLSQKKKKNLYSLIFYISMIINSLWCDYFFSSRFFIITKSLLSVWKNLHETLRINFSRISLFFFHFSLSQPLSSPRQGRTIGTINTFFFSFQKSNSYPQNFYSYFPIWNQVTRSKQFRNEKNN